MNDEEVLHFNPFLGIGDIIILKDIIVSGDLAPRYQINVNLGWIKQFRDKEYADFIVKFLKLFFDDDKYTLDFRDYACNLPMGVCRSIDIAKRYCSKNCRRSACSRYRMKFPDFSEFLCDKDFDVNEFKNEYSMNSYAVLSTRVRATVIDATLIKGIMAILLAKYDKLILIGENGQFASWQVKPEKDQHCIYNLCMEIAGNKHNDRIVDLTSNTLKLEHFFYENSVNRHANVSVSLGYGGNLIRQLYNNPHNLFALINTHIGFNHPYVSAALKAKKGKIFGGPIPCPHLTHDFLSSIEATNV